MTIPRISSLLIMLALGHDALATQMGQISSESVRGQPLDARITLYGMPSTPDAELSAELLPAFGAAPDSLTAIGVRAAIESDERGAQAIHITSSEAFAGASLALRVRLREGGHAALRFYELNIPAAPAPRLAMLAHRGSAVTPRRVARATAPLTQTSLTAAGSYGPVRAGQSLWGIMQQNGLATGNSQALMHDIVAANPQAFVGGDASRLRVGAMLQLPGRSVATSSAPVSAPATVPRASKVVTDAETAARLERLAVKFAEIRARYAAQKQAPLQADAPAEAVTVSHHATLATATASPPPAAAATPAQQDAPAPAAVAKAMPAKPLATAKPAVKAATLPVNADKENLLDTVASSFDGKALVGLGGGLLLVALLFGARFGRRLRARLAEAGLRSADQELVAEIARKAEKRVQLEGEVRRMIAGRREGGEESAASSLRPADLLAGVQSSLEDIETRIAHGQYNEAEAMLEQTIAETPNNHRAKLRLAEIYYLNERHEEFVDLADEIHRQHRSDIGDENWSRLMRMGKVIAPDRPPFSGPVAVEAGRRAR